MRTTRRRFMGSVVACAALASAAAAAPQGDRLPRVALLSNNVPIAHLSGPEPIDQNARAFVQGLRGLGYVDGRNIVIERRSAEGRPERLPAVVREVAALGVDVIVTYGPALTKAASEAPGAHAIVAIGPDFLTGNLASSLSRPGGRVTGLSLSAGTALNGKRLDLLRQLLPKAERVAFLRPRPTPGRPTWAPETEAAAVSLGLRLVIVGIDAPEELDAAFAAMARDRPDAVLCPDNPIYLGVRRRIVDFAARERLPVVYASRAFVEVGGLMSYDADLVDLSRRATTYVDKILRGARPGDLPIEQPTKFELVINLKAAKALGLAIPPSLLQRADQILE